MKVNVKFLIMSLCVVGGSVNAAVAHCSLQRPDGIVEKVELPFEYRHLTAEDRAHSVFVPECFYAVLGHGSELSSAVVGPLCPCIMVAVRYEALDKTLVFHMNNANSAQRVLEIVKKEFGQDIDGAQLQLRIFTKSVQGLPAAALAQLETSPEDQRAMVVSVSRALTETYGLKPEQKKNSIFSSVHAQAYSYYFESDKSVFVDKDLTIYSVSLLAERIFAKRPARLDDLARESVLVGQGYDAVLGHYMEKYFAGQAPILPLPFKRLPDSEMGLEKLAQ